MSEARRLLAGAARIVVKVGSSSLTDATGHLAPARLTLLVDAIARRWQAGTQMLLVTSGAIAAGLGPLGFTSRPHDLASQQAAASVGQGLLLQRYLTEFARHDIGVGQVLLTVGDISRQQSYKNAVRTLGRLLRLGALPVINENDTVATHEIRFGDNDRLAALVAGLVGAEGLVLLSDVDALYTAHPSEPGSVRIDEVDDVDSLDADTSRRGSAVGTGGMVTKLEAARIATGAGMPALIGSLDNVDAILDRAETGTAFAPIDRRRPRRLLWLAQASTARGTLTVDAGAADALTRHGASLLPAGITGVDGDFVAGEPVAIVDPGQAVVGRGLVAFSSSELQVMIGRHTDELAQNLGRDYAKAVVHRDALVLAGKLAHP